MAPCLEVESSNGPMSVSTSSKGLSAPLTRELLRDEYTIHVSEHRIDCARRKTLHHLNGSEVCKGVTRVRRSVDQWQLTYGAASLAIFD